MLEVRQAQREERKGKGRRRRSSINSLPNHSTALSIFLLLSTFSTLSSALPQQPHLTRRAEEDSDLSSNSLLSLSKVNSIEQILNRTASLSWEIGTHLESLLEFHNPSLSVYSSDFNEISPTTSPMPTQILSMTSYLTSRYPPSTSNAQIVPDGSSADPVSIAPFYVLSNYTLENDGDRLPTNGTSEGATKAIVVEAIERQVEEILTRTPRTSDGAISHRKEQVELWSDSVYMVPPFLAYYGVLSRNTSLLDEAYNQIRLYRQYLRDPSTGLWRHILFGDNQDDGLWSTGNGWVANGILRVLSTLENSDFDDQYKSEISDLTEWTREILVSAWQQPMRNGLLHNYLNETSSFVECSGTALLSSATFRYSTLSSNLTKSSPVLVSAEQAYQTLLNFHLSDQGVLAPVVDPMDYSSQLQNVKQDASGNVSPEGEAFVLLMESARRDWIDEGGSVEGLMAGGGTSGTASRSKGRALLTLVAVGVAAAAGLLVM